MDELHARPLARSPSPLPPEPPRIALPLSPTEKKQIDNVEIPWKSIVPLLLYRMADAATYVVIFPFITELITSLHVPHNRIGLYAGLGEGTLMVVEALFAPLWARWSDRYGRRPIMVWVSLFCSIPAVMMGFSNRVWHVILWRGLCK
jgi:MFS family permease